VVAQQTCASDLCFAAAERLLADLSWLRESVNILVFVSQTPDYVLPATSCSLHGRLGLSKRCATFDINMGCSGYVYGLWVAAQLLSANGPRRALLLVGDTISRIVSPMDRSTAPLFGDAGSATALEWTEGAAPIFFELGSDGSGQNHLIVPAGGFRQPPTPATSERNAREAGNVRSDEDLYMDGAEIFTFTLREVPPLIRSVLDMASWPLDDVDAFVLHQANRFMIQHVVKRMRIPAEKAVYSLEEYGNTSSASIPLTMIHSLAERLRSQQLRLVLAGFGVGLSWGGAAMQCGPMVVSNVVLVDELKVVGGSQET